MNWNWVTLIVKASYLVCCMHHCILNIILFLRALFCHNCIMLVARCSLLTSIREKTMISNFCDEECRLLANFNDFYPSLQSSVSHLIAWFDSKIPIFIFRPFTDTPPSTIDRPPTSDQWKTNGAKTKLTTKCVKRKFQSVVIAPIVSFIITPKWYQTPNERMVDETISKCFSLFSIVLHSVCYKYR